MAFLGRFAKKVLLEIADELGEEVNDKLKVAELKQVIVNSAHFEEEFVKGMAETIVEKEREAREEREGEI